MSTFGGYIQSIHEKRQAGCEQRGLRLLFVAISKDGKGAVIYNKSHNAPRVLQVHSRALGLLDDHVLTEFTTEIEDEFCEQLNA